MSGPPAVEDLPTGAWHRREDDWRIRLLQCGNVLYSRLYHRITVHQSCPLPHRGPAILVCNHTSGLDPLLVQSACPRVIRWMMAREYFDIRPLRWIFETTGVIPVHRSGRDMAATRAAMRALQEGYVVGVFPEGKIETTRQLLPFHNGIGLLALRTGAPVYPAYLDGTQRGKEIVRAYVVPNKADLAFAPAVELSSLGTSRSDVEQATGRIQAAIQVLQNRCLGSCYGQK